MWFASNTLLLANAFEKFRKMYPEIFELDPAKFLSASLLAWQAALEKTKVKLNLLTDIDTLLVVGKSIKRRNMSLFLSISKS